MSNQDSFNRGIERAWAKFSLFVNSEQITQLKHSFILKEIHILRTNQIRYISGDEWGSPTWANPHPIQTKTSGIERECFAKACATVFLEIQMCAQIVPLKLSLFNNFTGMSLRVHVVLYLTLIPDFLYYIRIINPGHFRTLS